MLVSFSMPCVSIRCFLLAFGHLGAGNTCRFHDPLCTQRSLRLFLEWVLIPCDETLTDHKTRISIGMALHLAVRAEHQGRTGSISGRRLPCMITGNQIMTPSTLSARVARVDSSGDDSLSPCLVLSVLADASLHPEGAFAVATAAILALLWLEIVPMLKHQDHCPMVSRKLDN